MSLHPERWTLTTHSSDSLVTLSAGSGVTAGGVTELLNISSATYSGGRISWSSSSALYMVKRDQMKEFDFHSPEGFHDAIRAYGLPTSIIGLATCWARTAYGLTKLFIINGLTKQGGNLSPCKCVLTASLLNWWLKDRREKNSKSLKITTLNHRAGTSYGGKIQGGTCWIHRFVFASANF